MLEKKFYANGQPVHKLTGEKLTYFYKTGSLKAEGLFIDDMMEGQWNFYRESGQLLQAGNFLNNKKH